MGILPRGGRAGQGALLGAVVVAALMVFVVPSGLASAAPTTASDSSGAVSWAYGGLSTISFSGTSSSGVPYVGNATYGFSVLITQTNSTILPNDFELTVGRTMGASFAVQYCLPNCHKPTYFAGLSARVWESINSTAFLLDNGTVNEPAGPVTAFALQNASTVQVDNISESTSSYLPAASGVGGVSRAGYLGVQLRTTGSVSFATPLGLYPTNLSTAQSWNSTAAFQSSLEAAYSYFTSWAGPLVRGTDQGNGTIPVQGAGTLNLSGSYAPADTIALDGAHFAEVALSIQGPFTLRDGLLLVPVASDLFQGSSEPWSGNESGVATASPSFVDLRSASAAGHFGLGASRWLYDSQTLEPTTIAPASSDGVTDLAGSGAPDAAPATVVQGQPESVAQAQSTQSCLVSGACSSGGGPGPLRGLLGLVALGGVAAAALIVAVVVVERRRMPPPTYPNAALYPPGANGTPRAGPTGPSPPPPSPPDEDPLGNLW